MSVSPHVAPPVAQIALYARASTQRQAQAQSVEQQLERLQARAVAQGWRVAPDGIFRDDGVSGATLRRPGLDHLRDRASSAQLDRVLVTAPDRLARNFVHQALLVEELERHGAVVEFLDRPMSQDPHDRLLLQIRGAVAEYERTLITDRMRRGRLRKLRAGLLLPWTQPPYGYRLAPDRPRDPTGVRLEEAEAAVVRDLFAWCADEGLPLSAIVRRLHDLGIPSPRGHAYWNRSAVRGVLTNPIYVGQVYANRMRTGRATRRHSALRPVGRRSETKVRTPAAEWIAVARVPAVVSPALFDAARGRLAENQRVAPRNAGAERYLLRCLVSCGHCRRGCGGRQAPGEYGYYVCRTKSQMRHLTRGERCRSRYLPVRELDALVWGDLCAVLQHPAMIGEAMARARGGHWVPQELEARRANLRRGHAHLTQQLERLTDAYLGGALELAEYRRRRGELETRLSALGRQTEQLRAEAHQRDDVARLAAHAGQFCRRVADGLAHADFATRRALVELLIDRVIVTDDLVEIRYVVPTGPAGEHQRFCLLRTDYLPPHPRHVRLLGAPAVMTQAQLLAKAVEQPRRGGRRGRRVAGPRSCLVAHGRTG